MMCLDFHELQIWAGVLMGVSLCALGFFVYKIFR